MVSCLSGCMLLDDAGTEVVLLVISDKSICPAIEVNIGDVMIQHMRLAGARATSGRAV